MTYIKISKTRIPILRARNANFLLAGMAIFTTVAFVTPFPVGSVLKILCITVADILLLAEYARNVSEIIISKYGLVIITPFSFDTIKFSSIKKISYYSIRSCFTFRFTVVVRNRRKRYSFQAIDSSIGSYAETVDVLKKTLEKRYVHH